MKTADLTGAQLDYWVARAENEIAPRFEHGLCTIHFCTVYAPSTDWLTCGPLIDKYSVDLDKIDGGWYAMGSTNMHTRQAIGATPQEAICRAVVRAAFGDEVPEVPCA